MNALEITMHANTSVPKKQKVLVIDDEPGFTKYVKIMLESRKTYEVCEVNNSAQALEIAREFLPSVIFLDVVMPGLDGGDVHSRLKADPSLTHIPVIFVTAVVTSKEVIANRGHMNGLSFVSKPASVETLIRCIEEHTVG